MPRDYRLTEAVLAAVADREGVDLTELKTPLNDVVDADALDALFRDGTGQVTFDYGGYTVTVDHAGDVTLHDSIAE